MMNQVVIVTGASRGLGAAVAQILGEMGARVIVTARSEDDLAHVADSVRDAGGEAVAVPGDISDPAVVRAVVGAAIERFGQLDAVVNNAGVLEPITRIADADPEAWRHNWAVNVVAPVMLTRAALPHLRAQNGRVINVSSGAAVNPKAGWGAYCAAKAALNQFNGTLALEEPAITALAVRPGMVDTEMQAALRREGKSAMTEKEYARFVDHYKRGEMSPPEVPGRAIAIMTLYAPQTWSGEFIRWDDERVAALMPK
jgi:NAD(P)-dependent dehydrogenase (short-subunit alcohol dehydrogenase family)